MTALITAGRGPRARLRAPRPAAVAWGHRPCWALAHQAVIIYRNSSNNKSNNIVIIIVTKVCLHRRGSPDGGEAALGAVRVATAILLIITIDFIIITIDDFYNHHRRGSPDGGEAALGAVRVAVVARDGVADALVRDVDADVVADLLLVPLGQVAALPHRIVFQQRWGRRARGRWGGGSSGGGGGGGGRDDRIKQHNKNAYQFEEQSRIVRERTH